MFFIWLLFDFFCIFSHIVCEFDIEIDLIVFMF